MTTTPSAPAEPALSFKVGLGPSINRFEPDQPLAPQLAAMVETARVAAEAGFGYLTAGHHWLAPGFLNPLLCFARLIPVSGDLDFHTSVFLLPQHNPFDIADQVAALDVLSGGRVVFGVGLGYRELEFTAAGMRKAERAGRLEEAIPLLRALWRGETVDHTGRYYRVVGGRASVLPVQRPGVPILIGAQNPVGVRRAGRLADGWILWGMYPLSAARAHWSLYQAARQEANRPGAGLIELKRYVHLAPTRQQAEAAARTYMERYWDNAFYQAGGLGEGGRVALELPWEQVLRERVVVGTPDEVVSTLQGLIDEFQLTRLALSWKEPGWTHREYWAAIRRLGREVLPFLRPPAHHH
jgi:alkanesulfonate monooxygenase SsuD/methylene tetrahydromethanopterin reductase-like flavin-dependent oxidoreductase (luciferase family)